MTTQTAEGPGVASLDRALAILAAFGPDDAQLTLAELAKRTGFYKSTILRLLATLERRRYVVRLAGGGYRLGPAVLHLGAVYQASFRLEDHVMPAMRTLVQRTGESASFFTLEGNTRVCLFRIDSPLSVRENHTRVGDFAPAARGPFAAVYHAFRNGLDRSRPAALRSLPHIDVDGTFPDLGAAVAPVFGFDGALAGFLMVSGPKARFSAADQRRIAGALLDAARDITGQLGGDADAFDAPAA